MKASMKNRHEFVTTRWQCLFNTSVKNVEISLITAVGAVVVNLVMGVFSQEANLDVIKTTMTFLFTVFFISIFTLIYYWVKIKFLNSELPKVLIDEQGIVLNEFGEIKKFRRDEITKISVKGYFNKIIHLTESKRSSIYILDYYLFSPEQRVEILALLNSMVGEASPPSKIN